MKIKRVLLILIGLLLVFKTGFVVAEDPQPSDLSRAVLKIESVSCGGCLSTIDSGLSQLEGYLGMGANLPRKLIAVDFAEPLTAAVITRIISNTGYPATLETVETITKEESFAFVASVRRDIRQGGGGCCGGGAAAKKDNTNQGSPGLKPPTAGACCPLPGIGQPTKKS